MTLDFRPVIPAQLSASSRGLAFSPDGRLFWTDKGALCLTDLDTERTQRLPISPVPLDFVAMTRDGLRIVLLSTEVAIFDIRRSSLRKLGVELSPAWLSPRAQLTPDEKTLCISRRNMPPATSVMTYDPMTGARTPQTPALASWNDDPHVHDIGRVLPWRSGVVGVVARDAVTFVDVSSGRSIGRFVADADISSAALSPDGSALHVHTTRHRSHLVRIEMA